MERSAYRILLGLFSSLMLSSVSDAHIRISPAGRMGTSDRVKFIQNNKVNPTVPDSPGPCATNTTRMATPLQLTGGQNYAFTIQETINHPGRFYVQFSTGGDAGFWQAANQLALVEDTQNNGTTNVPFVVPNMNCNTCTFRVLQEMDEQPGEFYVHCVDVNITAAGGGSPQPTPPPANGGGSEGTLSANKEFVKPGFGGCGVVLASTAGSGPRSGPGSTGGPGGALASSRLASVLFLLPLLLALTLRRWGYIPRAQQALGVRNSANSL